MTFTPDSTVYLLDTPLDNTYKNQLHFTSHEQQQKYFNSRRKHTFEGVTYIRTSNSIKVNKNIDELWNSNYVMYRNTNYTYKYFYAFITKMEYVSEQVTEIFIETDVYQTWLFECTLKPSFVLREHVKDDTIGKHLVDEQIECGEYIMQSYTPTNKMGELWNVLAVSDLSFTEDNSSVGNIYANIVSGLAYFAFPNTTEGIEWLRGIISKYDEAGKADAIVMIFTIPKVLLQTESNNPHMIPSNHPMGYDFVILQKNYSSIDGYTPKNNKLHTYPYKFLYVSNNVGQSASYRYEDFKNSLNPNEMRFKLWGAIMPNPTVMLAPFDYKGELGLKHEYGISLSGFPQGSWTSDAYTVWLAQNSQSVGIALAGSTLAVAGAMVTGNVIAGVGGALGIFSQIAQIGKASIQPDQAKGQVNNGSLHVASNTLDFFLSHMTIKAEFAKRIDDYFTMFGYKVASLKVPEITSRKEWNYVETIDVNIEGSIPDNDMNKLKEMYNKGVTFWHNANNFLNYGLPNTIR